MPRPTERLRIRVNGEERQVASGSTIASALLDLGILKFRRSVSGEPRSALCGMGVCMECRVVVEGVPHVLACQTEVREGMSVETDG